MRIVVDVRKGEPSAGHPEQPVQAHPAAGHLRDHHPGHRRPAAAGAEPARGLRAVHRLPPRGGAPAHAPSSSARPRRGPTSSRGYVIALDHLDEVIALIRAAKTPPETPRPAWSSASAHRDPGRRDPRAAAAAPDRPRAPEDPGRAQGAQGHDRRPQGHPGQARGASTRSSGTSSRRSARTTATPRRTEILEAVDEITVEDMIADEDVAISITHAGYIKRTSISTYRAQRRGGRGRVGMKTRDEDFVDRPLHRLHPLLHPDLHRPRPGLLAEGPRDPRRRARRARARPIVNLVQLAAGREDRRLLRGARTSTAGGYVLLATRKGIVKKTELAAFSNPRAGGHHRPRRGGRRRPDRGGAHLRQGRDPARPPAEGMAIHFTEEDVRPMGRTAYGVKGIELEDGRRGGGAGGGRGRGHRAHRDRERLRQAHRPRRVPPAEPRRQGPHQHQDLASATARWWA